MENQRNLVSEIKKHGSVAVDLYIKAIDKCRNSGMVVFITKVEFAEIVWAVYESMLESDTPKNCVQEGPTTKNQFDQPVVNPSSLVGVENNTSKKALEVVGILSGLTYKQGAAVIREVDRLMNSCSVIKSQSLAW